MSRLTRPAAVAGVLVILAIAFVRSFTALTDLAATNGVPTSQAWMLPLMLDTTTLVATLAVVTLERRAHRWYARSLVIVAASLSAAGNVAEVWQLGPVAIATAAVPPVLLLAMTELAVLLTRPVISADASVIPQPVPLFPRGSLAIAEDDPDLARSFREKRHAA